MISNIISLKSSTLGIKNDTRTKNLNKALIKAYNKGYKFLTINGSFSKKYNIKKEIKKRHLIMIIDSNNLGWRNEVRTKNLNKALIKAYNKGYKMLICDNFPEYNDKYIINTEIKKRKLI